MSQDLGRVLATSGQPALSELRLALGRAFEGAEAPAACMEEHTLKSRVYRLRFVSQLTIRVHDRVLATRDRLHPATTNHQPLTTNHMLKSISP